MRIVKTFLELDNDLVGVKKVVLFFLFCFFLLQTNAYFVKCRN